MFLLMRVKEVYILSGSKLVASCLRLTTGKNEKVDSLHVPVLKFIGRKQLV